MTRLIGQKVNEYSFMVKIPIPYMRLKDQILKKTYGTTTISHLNCSHFIENQTVVSFLFPLTGAFFDPSFGLHARKETLRFTNERVEMPSNILLSLCWSILCTSERETQEHLFSKCDFVLKWCLTILNIFRI